MSHIQLYTSPPLGMLGEGEPHASILGVPFDSTHSYRPGCRFAPDYIRGMYGNIELFHPRFGVDLEGASIHDAGNLAQTVDAAQMVKMVRLVVGELVRPDRICILLGGEHLLTLGSYMALSPETGMVVLDAHYDLRDSYAGARLSHASFLRRIAEERGGDDILHMGARACAAEEMAYLHESGIHTVSDDMIRAGEGPEHVARFAAGYNSLYVSIDMDVLDPAFCPGVGNPEACGITSRELLDIVRALSGYNIACADIVELNPLFDNGAGGAMAAKLLSELAAMSAAR